MLDRRSEPRISTRREVRIDMHPRWPAINCVVRNISPKGAYIELPDESNTSLAFDLIFVAISHRRACRQIWRQNNRLGVEFA